MNLSIHIPQFEGPLALLLYLIRKEEMDIFDIDIHLITTQYLEYIKKMKQFDLEVAGDFIAMAATLLQIKSKMLLPNYNEEDDEEMEDPRKELVNRLIEYQKFQEVSKSLYERPLLGRDVFRRGKTESIHSDEDGEIILDEGGLFSLIAHYRNSIRKMKSAVHRVASKTRSIAARILEMKDKFIVGQRLILRDLITDFEEAKKELLITFLSALEMGKMGLVSVYQSEIYGDIYLTAKREITAESISRVEEYDSQGAEAVADTMMAEAAEEALEQELAQEMNPEELQEPEGQELLVNSESGKSLQLGVEGIDPQDRETDPMEMATDAEIDQAEIDLNLEDDTIDGEPT